MSFFHFFKCYFLLSNLDRASSTLSSIASIESSASSNAAINIINLSASGSSLYLLINLIVSSIALSLIILVFLFRLMSCKKNTQPCDCVFLDPLSRITSTQHPEVRMLRQVSHASLDQLRRKSRYS